MWKTLENNFPLPFSNWETSKGERKKNCWFFSSRRRKKEMANDEKNWKTVRRSWKLRFCIFMDFSLLFFSTFIFFLFFICKFLGADQKWNWIRKFKWHKFHPFLSSIDFLCCWHIINGWLAALKHKKWKKISMK